MAFNILIVDDSETMRAVIKKTVNMCGIELGTLQEAGNGFEALEIMAEYWVDVVLSDINMPEMGGVELLRTMQGDEVLKKIPLIFISTESSQSRQDEAARLGAAGYIKKPFLPEQIRDILLEVLNKAYAGRMAAEGSSPPVDDEDLDF